MKKGNLLFLPFLVFSVFVSSKIHADDSTPKVDWDARINEVCTYDRAWCGRIKSPLDTGTVEILERVREVIYKAGEIYDVDPRVIAASILAEHSMNGGVTDSYRNSLVKKGQVPENGKILGIPFSFGFGRLHQEACEDVEQSNAKVENRQARTPRQIQNEMLTVEGSIFYVAGILRRAQDVYARYGFRNIKDNPEILATLYNLGKYEMRAEESKKSGRTPRPNYFGVFAGMHMGDIEQIVKKHRPSPTTVTEVASASPPTATENKATESSKPVEKMIPVYKARSEIKLTNGPTSCFDPGTFPATNGSVTKGSSLTVVSQTVDCDLKQWVRVQTSDGTTGWVSSKTLRSETTVAQVGESACKKTISNECRENLLKQFKNHVAHEFADGEIEFNMNMILPAQSDMQIVLRKQLTAKESANLAILNGYDNLRRSEIDEIDRAITQFEKKVAVALKLDPWGDTSNPYLQYYNEKFYLFEQICKRQNTCVMNKAEFLKWLNGIKIKKAPSNQDLVLTPSQELKTLIAGSYANFEATALGPYRDFTKEVQENILKPFAKCKKIAAAFPASRQALAEMSSKIGVSLEQQLGTKGVTGASGGMSSASANAMAACPQCAMMGNGFYNGGYGGFGGYYGGYGYGYGSYPGTGDLVAKTQIVKTLATALSNLNKVCLSFEEHGPAENRPGGDGGPHCEAWQNDGTGASSVAHELFLKSFHSEQEKDAYLAKAIHDLQPAMSIPNDIADLRDLAEKISAVSCVKAVYVPEPWLAASSNQIYRESGKNVSSVWVDLSKMSCTMPDEKKEQSQ